MKLSTKSVVAIGIGAALYGALSAVAIPVGPNTSFRLAIALLTIFGAMYGPIVGFLVGFIGHALNDLIMWGSVWWSWVFLSAIIGLFAGFITLDRSFDVEGGKVTKGQLVKMYLLAIAGMIVAGLVAYVGDVFFYGEPADKVWLQIGISTISNFVVTALVGIPVVNALAKKKQKHSNLDVD